MVESASLFILGSFVVACPAKVTRFPQPGESLRAEAFTLVPGGKGFNMAAGGEGVAAALPECGPELVVDTPGTGDAFTAGLAAALAEGRPLREGLRRTAACGALVASRPGVFDALPTRAALERFLGQGSRPFPACFWTFHKLAKN